MFISQPALLKNETREIKLNINLLKKKLQLEDYGEVRQAAKQGRKGLHFCTDYIYILKQQKKNQTVKGREFSISNSIFHLPLSATALTLFKE